MATRGKPLAWSARERVKSLVRDGVSRRKAADAVGVHRNTANKYAKSLCQTDSQS